MTRSVALQAAMLFAMLTAAGVTAKPPAAAAQGNPQSPYVNGGVWNGSPAAPKKPPQKKPTQKLPTSLPTGSNPGGGSSNEIRQTR